MLATQSPFVQYFDTDGSPLDGGSVYFGVANQNPETAPVAVYWDAAGTQPAAQPIRTLNGYTVRGGSPAATYTAGNYSLTTRNARGALVVTVPNSAATGNDQALQDDIDDIRAELVIVDQDIDDLNANVAEVEAACDAVRSGRSAPNGVFDVITDDFAIVGCAGPNQAYIEDDIADVFLSKYGGLMSGVTKYVAPASKGGNDSNTGDSWASPYLTLNKAVRNVAVGTVYLWPGTYEPDGFRYTDTGGGQPKRIVAPFGGVTIATSGDTLSAATWAANGTYPNVYETTLVALPAAATPIRVLLTTIVDKHGEPMPIPKQSSLSAVDGSVLGWWYDSATRILYVRNGAENVQTTTKANLVAVYAPGGDNSILLLSTKSYWEGITFHAYAYILKQAGQAAPEGWFKRCTFKYAESTSRNVQGGGCYTQDCRFYRSAGDHGNYNTFDGTTSYALEVRDITQFAGDVATFGSAATQPNNPISTGQNKNGSSNHDSILVRVNCYDDGAYGPNYADTNGSYTWNLGCRAGYSYAIGSSRYGFITQGATARGWYDGCAAVGGNSGINSDSGAVVNYFNTFGTRSTTSGGTFAAYIPA